MYTNLVRKENCEKWYDSFFFKYSFMSYFDIITSHIPEENRGARDGEGLERVRM